MHVILTHEQADFDAIGALLAARILNEQAYAVLPRRVNRNVRAFLNLYGCSCGKFHLHLKMMQPTENVTI